MKFPPNHCLVQFKQGDRDAFIVKFPGIFLKKYMYIYLKTRNIQKVYQLISKFYTCIRFLFRHLYQVRSVQEINSNGTVLFNQ